MNLVYTSSVRLDQLVARVPFRLHRRKRRRVTRVRFALDELKAAGAEEDRTPGPAACMRQAVLEARQGTQVP